MALQFFDYKYETTKGVILMIRMSQQAKAAIAANAEPSGDLDVPLRVKQSATAKEAGISPRLIVGTRTTGSGAALKTFYTYIPLLDPSVSIANGTTFSFNGNTWSVSTTRPEVEDTQRIQPPAV